MAQGSSQAAAQKYNQQTDQINAGQALSTSAAEAQRDQIRAQRSVASSAADFGASGVALGSGSPLNVLADQAAQGALNASIVQYRGASQATSALNSAQQAGFQASQDADAGAITAGTTLLTQGARYATSLYPRTTGAVGAGL